MDRRDFFKKAGLGAISIPILAGFGGATATAMDVLHTDEPSKMRKVYRIKEGKKGVLDEQFREELVHLEDLEVGDVFHMYEFDGTPVDDGILNIVRSAPIFVEGRWEVRVDSYRFTGEKKN